MAVFQVKSNTGSVARIVARNKSVFKVTATHRGAPGTNGASAYQSWLDLGNEGDENAFFDFLRGIPGEDGKSAYQEWLDLGNSGDVLAFLDTLVGAPGDDGANGKSAYEIAVAQGFVGTEEEWLASLQADGLERLFISPTEPPTPILNDIWIKVPAS